MKTIDTLQAELATAIQQYGYNDPRSQQSRDGILGPSDIGFCRQKAVLTATGKKATDERSLLAAQIGTAFHRYAAQAFAAHNPAWLCDNEKVTATFPSGAEISGTPDLICPDYNAIIDVKTVDGFTWVRREGTSLNHQYQRHTYALGAIQNGLLDPTRTVYVGNLYIDRSGKETEPLLLIEPFDDTLTDAIDSWIGDVIYAMKTGEDASRDIPAVVCEKICEFFTLCRGSLEMSEGAEQITDPSLKSAIRMYVEGRELEKSGGQMKKEASAILHGINGTDGEWVVRWVDIAPSSVQAYDRPASRRIDVVKARRG